MEELKRIVLGFIILGSAFWIIEKFFGSKKVNAKKDWQDIRVDLTYWVLAPILNKGLTKLGVLATLFLVATLIGKEEFQQRVTVGYGPVVHWPLYLQIIAALVAGDFVAYWMHRFFHRYQWPWRVHAIHHSPTVVNWLSATRVHPLNQLISRVPQILFLFLLGFPIKTIALYLPSLVIYALFLHTNIRFHFGPLRYVIATPNFHRWHHTSAEEGCDKNFSGLFVFWDILFGTFYLPGSVATKFGVQGIEVPKSFWRQMWFPFSSR